MDSSIKNKSNSYLGTTSSFDVISRLPTGVVTPEVSDPIVSPLVNWINSSPKFEEMTGSSNITTRFVFERVSLMTGLAKECREHSIISPE